MVERATGKGRLIVICGIDGSGKATQADLLAERAEAEGRAVSQVSFPRYGEGFFADLIQRYLRGEFAGRAADVSPYMASLPYACDRWEAAPKLRRWLTRGRLVLCNRYVPANMAHQGCKIPTPEGRRAFYDWVEQLEYGVFKLPQPDLHLLLDMPYEASLRLIAERNAAKGVTALRDIHESDAHYLKATAEAYRELVAREPARWATVECVQDGAVLSRGEIASRVWAAASRIMYNE